MSDLSFAERVLRTAVAELGSTDFVKYAIYSTHSGSSGRVRHGAHQMQPHHTRCNSYSADDASFATWCVWRTWVSEDPELREPAFGVVTRYWAPVTPPADQAWYGGRNSDPDGSELRKAKALAEASRLLVLGAAMPCVGHRNIGWEVRSDAEASQVWCEKSSGGSPKPGDLLLFGADYYDVNSVSVCERSDEAGLVDIASVKGTVIRRSEGAERGPLFGWVSL